MHDTKYKSPVYEYCASIMNQTSKGLSERGRNYVLKPNFAAGWLAILHRVREVPGSNLGQETGYPD
jgi:hypothetical protein